MPPLVDKVASKTIVSRLLGDDWIIPTIWTGDALPVDPPWPYPFILKATHGCNQNVVCHDRADVERARVVASRWTDRPYGLWLDEWAYRDLPRGYIVEPYLGDGATLPLDYKIYVFGGVAAFVQVHFDRGGHHRWVLYDRNWNRRSGQAASSTMPPATLAAMLAGAEMIAGGFEFARVDFYDIEGVAKFGEVTFYPGSGLDRFATPELDRELGALWLAARQERQPIVEPLAPELITA